MNVSFKDKKVLVTGAGRGIGKGLALALYKDGAIVYALSKTVENLKALAAECPGIKIIPCDLSNWSETEKALGGLEAMDYLVNNAGVAVKQKLLDSTEDVFDLLFNVNVKSYINVTKIVANKMVAAGKKGSIVNVSSVGGIKPHPDLLLYNMTKGSVEMMTKGMAQQLGPHGIRVNSINPTIIMTDMGTDLWAKTGEEVRKRLPLQQFPTTEHCVNAVLYLLSDLSERTTGAYLPVDSGDLVLY